MSFLDFLTLMFPSAGFLVMAAWLRTVRAASTAKTTVIARRDDHIVDLENQLAEALDAGRVMEDRAREWHTAWRVECAKALGFSVDAEARAN